MSCRVDAAERRLAQLLQVRPRPSSERLALADDVREMSAREADAAADPDLSDREKHAISFHKWQVMHRYLHAMPFRDRSYAKRSDQWRDALARVRDLGDRELLDWVCLQIEVATNIERGIQDLRPRDGGPTFIVLLEYVGNRKRKALAILKWHISAEGADTASSVVDLAAGGNKHKSEEISHK